MGEFGWAFVSGSNAAGSVDGTVQLKNATNFSGSDNLIFDSGNNLKITGSVLLSGNLSASAEISASAYYGDGSNLTGITSVSIANDGVNRILTADGDGTMSAESNLTFDGSTMVLTGTLNVSGTVNANAYNANVTNKSVINLTATGSTNFGDTTDDVHQFTGSVRVSGGVNLVNISSGTATTSSYLALDSSNNVILTSSNGGSGGTIGAAEDAGGYGDGLFTDFTISTAIGTPIDRFNEVLKILSPTPAPNISTITGSEPSGIAAKLSFGSSKVVTDYTSSGVTAGFAAVDAVGIYSANVSGSNFRLGIYDGTQDITGAINYHVVDSITNNYMAYSNNSFGNANEGTLKLELNGTVIHTVSLSGLAGAGSPNSGSGTSLTGQTGFINTSVSASSYDGNNSEWYIFKYRTAKYKIAATDQKVGWNYARVIHTLTSDNETNYVEWINDPSGAVGAANMSASNGRIEDITLTGAKYLSGVKYNTDATAKYKVNLTNLYSNVYAASGNPISFTATNSSTPSEQSVEDLGGGENKNKILGVTGSLDFNGSTLFNGAITCNTTVTHPLKTTITNTGSATTGNGFLIDNRSLASTNLEEKLHDESYRKSSGSYTSQASVSLASAVWNSQTHMTGTNVDGHQDGLLFHNQRLYSPVDGDIPNGGDFKAMSNASGSSQPDYVNDTPLGTRTFYRVLTNSSGVTKRDMKIVSTKNGTKYNNLTLNSSNTHLFAKIPGSTGWMDMSQPFNYGSSSDGHGALIVGATSNSNTGSTDTTNSTHCISFGTQSVANSELIMLKMVADESWGGYLTQLSFSLGASTSSAIESNSLDNIDLDDTDGESVRLSFGTNNVLSDYSRATGSAIGLSDFNINGLYNDEGTSRRGVFKAFETMGGTLNEDVSASGSNYPANSFKNAYTGSLLLIINDATASTLSLVNLGANNNLSSNTGFSVGSVDFSTTTDGIPDYTKPYRTGTYSIGTNQQNVGWNYARIVHRIGATDTLTNYVEWVVDPSGSTNDTVVSTPTLDNFNHLDVYYQSGIGYFASRPSASFEYSASNFYRNVYQNGTAISFPTTTNCSVSSITTTGSGVSGFTVSAASANMPLLNSSSNCHLSDIQVTGTVLFDDLTSISGAYGSNAFTHYDIVVDGQVLHPFKTDRTTSQLSKTSFMVYSGSIGSTTLTNNEYFNTEDYRIVSGNYANQTNATSSANTWNSQTHMNAANAHGDGMVTANGYAISPLKIGNAGDTRNSSDGGLLQAPAGNPNYSTGGLSEDVRTYYRYFQNTTGQAKPTFTVTLYGEGTIASKSGAFYTGSLGANRYLNVELKVPFDDNFTGDDDTSTAWGDCVKPYSAGVQPSTDGVGIYSGGGAGLDQELNGGAAIGIQLQEKQIRNNQYFVVKVSTHKNWTGYLSRILITY
jgi:hypothetical protein